MREHFNHNVRASPTRNQFIEEKIMVRVVQESFLSRREFLLIDGSIMKSLSSLFTQASATIGFSLYLL